MKCLWILGTAATLALTACGGSDEVEPIAKANAAPVYRIAQTLDGRWINRVEAARLEQSLGRQVLVVNARPGDDSTLLGDIGQVMLQRQHLGLPPDVLVLVHGSDLQRADLLAERLRATGLSRVMVVTG
jgi:hypothetical protein